MENMVISKLRKDIALWEKRNFIFKKIKTNFNVEADPSRL
jgi:hypothetical protein